jgi:hypothetical protein
MKLLAICLSVFLIAAPLEAQRGGGGRGGGGGGRGGGGGGGFRGGAVSGGARGGAVSGGGARGTFNRGGAGGVRAGGGFNRGGNFRGGQVRSGGNFGGGQVRGGGNFRGGDRGNGGRGRFDGGRRGNGRDFGTGFVAAPFYNYGYPYYGYPYYDSFYSPIYTDPIYTAPIYWGNQSVNYSLGETLNYSAPMTEPAPVLYPSAPVQPEPPGPTPVVVLKDGQVIEAPGLAVVGSTLWIMEGAISKKLSINDVDTAATQKTNRDRGVKLVVPGA